MYIWEFFSSKDLLSASSFFTKKRKKQRECKLRGVKRGVGRYGETLLQNGGVQFFYCPSNPTAILEPIQDSP